MTREENLLYRRQCPYDAMGDYSVLMENEKKEKPILVMINERIDDESSVHVNVVFNIALGKDGKQIEILQTIDSLIDSFNEYR